MEEKKPETENKETPEKEASPSTQEAVPPQEETEQQINWKKFREAREKERKEKIEAEKRASEKEAEVQALRAAMEALVNKPNQSVPQQQEFVEESEEQKIARLIEQSLERERLRREKEALEKEKVEFPQKLKRDFPDFTQVCTSENLDYFEYHYPEVADAFKYMPDGYEKWSKVYNAVKRFVPQSKNQNSAIAEHNLKKPQSMSIAGKTATGDTAPVYLDDKRKADNWERMQKRMRSTT